MNYLVVGAGGVGGALGAALHRGGRNVTLGLRGARLKQIAANGLVWRDWGREPEVLLFPVEPSAHLQGAYDVVFLCVKDYSLEGAAENLRRMKHRPLAVIPVMNGLGGTERLRRLLPEDRILDSCIYINARTWGAAGVERTGEGFKLILEDTEDGLARQIGADLSAGGVQVKCSREMDRDKFLKFSFISPLSACQAYFGVGCGELLASAERLDLFRKLSRELLGCGAAMGLVLAEDSVEKNVARLGKMPPESLSSMARDYLEGRACERRIMVDDVAALGRRLGCPVERYAELATLLGGEERQ